VAGNVRKKGSGFDPQRSLILADRLHTVYWNWSEYGSTMQFQQFVCTYVFDSADRMIGEISGRNLCIVEYRYLFGLGKYMQIGCVFRIFLDFDFFLGSNFADFR
jgi:hypothetical protein